MLQSATVRFYIAKTIASALRFAIVTLLAQSSRQHLYYQEMPRWLPAGGMFVSAYPGQ